MGLNDEHEKLRQAKAWLMNCEPASQRYRAAWEHVTYVLTATLYPTLRAEAQEIADQVLERNSER